jgi:CubicO group peptidase (beta-lactamase class C family)
MPASGRREQAKNGQGAMRRIRLLSGSFCVLICACPIARGLAQQPQPTAAIGGKRAGPPVDLVPVLQPILEKHPQLPGLVGAIVDGNRISAIGAVGLRRVGSPEKFTAGDLIHLGSDTKAMTATLIGKLFESKQLRETDTMADVFPELRQGMNGEMAGATVGQLLEHTASLPANVDWWAIDRTRRSLSTQRRMVVAQALAMAPANPPGTHYEYSNVGFVILGAILEEKTGKAWEELVKTELFKPLGMTTAGFGAPGTPGWVDQPWGHRIKNGEVEPLQFDNPPLMDPAGRVHCSISDWGKFISLYIDPDHASAKILSPQMIRELTTPGKVGTYAGGWIVTKRSWAGGRTLTHAGSNLMWYCVVWAAPNRHFAVLSATNIAGVEAHKACDEASGAMVKFRAAHKDAL